MFALMRSLRRRGWLAFIRVILESGPAPALGGIWRGQASVGPALRIVKLRKLRIAIAYCGAALRARNTGDD
ncbi:MAG: hypothetical protein B7Y43_03615 [Sphingomonas sp. 28-62-20]|nr:MAG: hypothetical protein B7Y43_03615 [Sphingomonas sp. 28-62-20]